MIVYGASVSYYTGKLEAYLRYKGIDYERASPYAAMDEIREAVGCIQHPMVRRDDGRWMSDSTPMLMQLETEYPDRPILPANPVVRFISMLVEDYADEWLWRSAMHFRWSYDHDSALLSRILADELTTHLPMPRWMRVRMVKKRQLTGFVVNDGVTGETREHVEAGYHRVLAIMSGILATRPYLLGQSPSLADFGLMGPMLRHFGQDPTPAEIMRDTAPLVFEWLARLWSAGERPVNIEFLESIPDDLEPLLREVCETHLVQLEANARAYEQGAQHFDMKVQNCQYRQLPVSQYRVYCLEILREQFSGLDEADQHHVRSLLPYTPADLIWSTAYSPSSGYDEARNAPFNKAINVFAGGVPG